MRKSVIGVAINGAVEQTIPYVYDGTKWVHIRPKIYLAGWQDIGGAGTLFYNFLEHGGNYYNSTDNLLIRPAVEYDQWKDKNGNVIHVTDHNVTTGSNAILTFALKQGTAYSLLDSDSKYLKDSTGKNLSVRR